jgi:hypothetical protein
MTTTGTYAYAPSAANIVTNAFAMIQIRRPDIDTAKLLDASEQANLLMVDFTNRNPHRWALETQTQLLALNTATYTLTNRTLAIGLATVTINSGVQTLDRVIGPISATEYAALPNKAQSGPPTSYFFNLQTTPTISVWPVPDAATVAQVGTLTMTTFRQMQDVDLTNGQSLDAPYRFLDAFTTGLASRLGEMYPDNLVKAKGPQALDRLESLYEKRLTIACSRDHERTPTFLTPGLNGYFR